jgi:Protein of unknown function (DUF3040)
MSDRERRVLESIEHELRRTDPRFVRQFARLGKRRITGPSMLLTLGLVVMVLGSAIVSVPVALLGIAIAAVALVAAYYRPLGFRFSGG